MIKTKHIQNGAKNTDPVGNSHVDGNASIREVRLVQAARKEIVIKKINKSVQPR